MSEIGTKHDGGKLKWTLVPFKGLQGMVRVLMFGRGKYAAFNWVSVEDWHERYLDAAFRHLTDYADGDTQDPESGESHLDHALCCLVFIRALQMGMKKPERFNEVKEKVEHFIEVTSARKRGKK